MENLTIPKEIINDPMITQKSIDFINEYISYFIMETYLNFILILVFNSFVFITIYFNRKNKNQIKIYSIVMIIFNIFYILFYLITMLRV